MTSQHFIGIAAILAGDFAVANEHGKQVLFCTTLSLADYFQSVNPRFNRSKFYEAVFGRDNPKLWTLSGYDPAAS